MDLKMEIDKIDLENLSSLYIRITTGNAGFPPPSETASLYRVIRKLKEGDKE